MDEASREEARRERRGAGALIAAVAVVIAAGAWSGGGGRAGEPRRPSRADEIVARVPSRAHDPATASRQRLARRLSAAPRDLATAVRLARLDIQAARAAADPRFLGRAEAVLAPWWSAPAPPAEVLLLRATIRQSRHDFDAALRDLDRLAAAAPGDAQVWLTRAVVLGVRARYADGLASCERLRALASAFVVAACRAPLLGLTGHARDARAALAAALPVAPTPAERAWGLSLLGELDRWIGDERAAEAELGAALDADPDDGYARAALADLLLDGGRAAEAAALATRRAQDDDLLLRAALAGDRAAADTTRARIEAARRRGDGVHRREEARFALGVDADARGALALAVENWRVQREPADARVLLEAALAAGDRAAAAPALAWLDETGFEWPRLRRLAAELRGPS